MARKEELIPGPVLALRAELDKRDIAWQPVNRTPQATYLLPEVGAGPGYTVWWQGPVNLIYLWGHDLEFQDATPEDVIKRLENL